MNFFYAALLGIVQGVTEWLPVSSSAQVTIVGSLTEMTIQEAFSFALFLHFGTLMAVLVKFRDIKLYLTRFIVIATAVTGVIGVPLYFFVQYSGELISVIIGVSLILTGLILRFSQRQFGTTRYEESTSMDSFIAGFFQGFSILPGISRSGVTVSSLLFRGFSQEEALKISFLMSVPAVIGGIILDAVKNPELLVFHSQYIVIGIIFAFFAGYLAMDVLLKVAKKVPFDLFCIAFGILTLVILW
ncbi:MAG: undecaprenyl-diphosphate phosphatase [Euryarchaeota archaeon]|nr:undecaprenyl-diphosphate phosphatase [Euryarchaeota archaeon]